MIVQNNVVIKIEPIDVQKGMVTIPHNTTEIGNNAAQNMTEITEIIIPNSCKQIGSYAFANTGLTNFVIPFTVQFAGVSLFEGCKKLSQINILNPGLRVQNNWFDSCPELKIIQHGALKIKVMIYNQSIMEVLSNQKIGVYDIIYVQKYKEKEKFYIALRGPIYTAACTVDRAIEECQVRCATPDLAEKYRDINLETTIGGLDYKMITGACDNGVDEWLKQNNYTWNSKITVKEFLERKDTPVFWSKKFTQFIADRYGDRAKKMEKKDGTK